MQVGDVCVRLYISSSVRQGYSNNHHHKDVPRISVLPLYHMIMGDVTMLLLLVMFSYSAGLMMVVY